MLDEKFKWLYSFFLLVVVVLWGTFNIMVVKEALEKKMEYDILSAAGASAISGALIAWNGQVITYWFRKRPTGDHDTTPDEPIK